MTAALAQDVLDPAVLAIVGSTATRLAGTYGFNPADRDDIGQELHLDCVIRLRKFVPTKSSRSTFVRRIVHHRVATLLCAQRAACRDYRRCRDSLDGPVPYGAAESVPLGETVSADDYESWIGRTGRSSWERTELRIDVSHVIAALPPELRLSPCCLDPSVPQKPHARFNCLGQHCTDASVKSATSSRRLAWAFIRPDPVLRQSGCAMDRLGPLHQLFRSTLWRKRRGESPLEDCNAARLPARRLAGSRTPRLEPLPG
jgi:DNA-directed RNA polymerase specialized sigma24 family protein